MVNNMVHKIIADAKPGLPLPITAHPTTANAKVHHVTANDTIRLTYAEAKVHHTTAIAKVPTHSFYHQLPTPYH